MKVTATGVSEGAGMHMFQTWLANLEESQAGETEIDVRFVLENENART